MKSVYLLVVFKYSVWQTLIKLYFNVLIFILLFIVDVKSQALLGTFRGAKQIPVNLKTWDINLTTGKYLFDNINDSLIVSIYPFFSMDLFASSDIPGPSALFMYDNKVKESMNLHEVISFPKLQDSFPVSCLLIKDSSFFSFKVPKDQRNVFIGYDSVRHQIDIWVTKYHNSRYLQIDNFLYKETLPSITREVPIRYTYDLPLDSSESHNVQWILFGKGFDGIFNIQYDDILVESSLVLTCPPRIRSFTGVAIPVYIKDSIHSITISGLISKTHITYIPDLRFNTCLIEYGDDAWHLFYTNDMESLFFPHFNTKRLSSELKFNTD